eukprot:142804-Chlamydomonas_euryale.AAC.1
MTPATPAAVQTASTNNAARSAAQYALRNCARPRRAGEQAGIASSKGGGPVSFEALSAAAAGGRAGMRAVGAGGSAQCRMSWRACLARHEGWVCAVPHEPASVPCEA